MPTQFLTDWEMLALSEGIQLLLDEDALDQESGEALLDKLERATRIRLSFKG